MSARRERGVFKFQVECFQDSSDGKEEWCIATKEYRSMTRWSADCAEILRSITPPNNAELSRCLQLFVQQGLTSPYNTDPTTHLISASKPESSAPRVYPLRSPKTIKGSRMDSKSPSLKIAARYPPDSAPLAEGRLSTKASKSPIVNQNLRAKISPKPVSSLSRPVRKKPQAIPISSSDEGSISSASESGRVLRPKNSIPIESARTQSLHCPQFPSTCPERSDVSKASSECGVHHSQATRPTSAPEIPKVRHNSVRPLSAAADNQSDGAASDSSLDYSRSDSPIVLIETGPDIGRASLHPDDLTKGKRLSPIIQPSLSSRPDKKARPTTLLSPEPSCSLQEVLRNNLAGRKVGEVFRSQLNPIYLNEARPYKRADLPGGVIFSEDDDVLTENGLVKPKYIARLSPMFAKHAIIIPPSCSGAMDNHGRILLALAQSHTNELFCLVRRRKITYDLFSQVILLHHASEAFYLALDLISARILQNINRRLKPPSMRDKNLVKVFPGCAECSSFIAITTRQQQNEGDSEQAFCLFCDMPYPTVGGIVAVQHQFSSILQPHLPRGGYWPTATDVKIASQWLIYASRNPGPILSFIFTVFAMIPPGWGVHMLSLMKQNDSDLKLCGHCGLGIIIGHSWHDCFRCTWCMGKRSTHRRNLVNPDGLLYHLNYAVKLYKAVESESSFLTPITKANTTGESSISDSEPYLTPSRGENVVMNQSSGSNLMSAYHNANENRRPQDRITVITGINSMHNDDAPSTALAPQACEEVILADREFTMLQRIDATSPASTSPQTTACFPIIEPAEFMATEISAINTTTTTTKDAAEEARINAALARKLSAPGELELDYNASEE